jgi:glycerol dehydrogenase-like iron-containing ADH family enzyme
VPLAAATPLTQIQPALSQVLWSGVNILGWTEGFATAAVMTATDLRAPILLAPAGILRGWDLLASCGGAIARLGKRPLVLGGDRALALARPQLERALDEAGLNPIWISSHPDCSEAVLKRLHQARLAQQADLVIGIGGGKALDSAKLVAHQAELPVVTIPTSAATCAAWTALSNIYSDAGAFLYDVPLNRCPDLLLLDYSVIFTAPPRLLVAGIGDALAKWYESSVSSGHSSQTLIIAAVQQARVLRDLLFQKALSALEQPGGDDWCEVVDASVLLAGVIGGLGGAQCRTVAAHAVHNGLTHLPGCHGTLHGEKVAYGILVQLRLEELQQHNQLAATARQQLLSFYQQLGLPTRLEDLQLGDVTLSQLKQAAELACLPSSDIHHLPFEVAPQQLLSAMVSTTAPAQSLMV